MILTARILEWAKLIVFIEADIPRRVLILIKFYFYFKFTFIIFWKENLNPKLVIIGRLDRHIPYDLCNRICNTFTCLYGFRGSFLVLARRL